MKVLKQFLACFLCFCIIASNNVIVSQAKSDNKSQENILTEIDVEIATYSDATSSDAVEETAEDDIDENNDTMFNWLVLGYDYLETPDCQYVVADIGSDEVNAENVILTYMNQTTGVTYQQSASLISGTSVVFYIEHADKQDEGIYELTMFEYTLEDQIYTVKLRDIGITALYGVNTVVDVDPTAWAVDANSDESEAAGVVITDASGNELSGASISEAISELGIQETTPVGASTDNGIVVVLSPGHSGSDPGATRTWNGVTYVERDLTLKIANYCKEELEKQPGITVYMTRYDNTTECTLEGRVEYAKSVNADLYVSLHLNAASSTAAHGAEIHIPSADYAPDLHDEASKLGQEILDKLVALGLTNRGLVIQYNTKGYTNPDGSTADYLAELRYCKWANIPGVLVEHAFLSNPTEAMTYLGSEEAIKALGIADAQGIIEYLNNRAVTIECTPNNKAIDITAQYKLDAEYQYRFLVYDVAEKKWELISDWGNDNTVSWKPDKGDYWIQAEVGLDGERISYSTITYSSEVDYTRPYVNLNGYAIINNQDSISVGAYYVTNDDNIMFQWKSYNLQTQKWELIHGWDSGNWITWKPQMAPYWLSVEALLSDGTVESYTTAYTPSKDYRDSYIDLQQFVTIDNGDSVSVGVAYQTDLDDIQFQWKAYDLSTKKWELVSGWSSGNWITWKPHAGDYWLRVESRSIDGTVENDYTEVFVSTKNYDEKFINLNGICIDEGNTYMAAGVAYQSNADNVQFQWKAYNLDTQKWELISGWSSGNWMNWKPEKGNYWLRAEAKSDDGIENSYTVIYSSEVDYTKPYIVLDGIDIIDNLTSYTLKAKYRTNSSDSSVRWLIYDLQEQEWSVLVDWGGNDVVTWNPGDGTSYWVRAEVRTSDGLTDDWCEAYELDKYSIMGTSNVNVEQMMAYYNANATYPSFYLSSDAPTIEEFCKIYIEECEAEGVKAEVAFCQAMKETGFLRYGGVVQIEQYNFAGIGATGSATPASFSTVREGIRAQVQHLKAYACKDVLNNACVDPRFDLVSRGCAPYVEWLGINENPYGYGWATAKNYGYSIKNDYISKLLIY